MDVNPKNDFNRRTVHHSTKELTTLFKECNLTIEAEGRIASWRIYLLRYIK